MVGIIFFMDYGILVLEVIKKHCYAKCAITVLYTLNIDVL